MCSPDVPERGEGRKARECKQEVESITRCRGDILPFLKRGSANWVGGLKAFSTWRGRRPPDNTDSADTTASFLTGRYDTQPQCHSNTFTVAAQTPIMAV